MSMACWSDGGLDTHVMDTLLSAEKSSIHEVRAPQTTIRSFLGPHFLPQAHLSSTESTKEGQKNVRQIHETRR